MLLLLLSQEFLQMADALWVFKSLICAYWGFDVLLVKTVGISYFIPRSPCPWFMLWISLRASQCHLAFFDGGVLFIPPPPRVEIILIQPDLVFLAACAQVLRRVSSPGSTTSSRRWVTNTCSDPWSLTGNPRCLSCCRFPPGRIRTNSHELGRGYKPCWLWEKLRRRRWTERADGYFRLPPRALPETAAASSVPSCRQRCRVTTLKQVSDEFDVLFSGRERLLGWGDRTPKSWRTGPQSFGSQRGVYRVLEGVRRKRGVIGWEGGDFRIRPAGPVSWGRVLLLKPRWRLSDGRALGPSAHDRLVTWTRPLERPVLWVLMRELTLNLDLWSLKCCFHAVMAVVWEGRRLLSRLKLVNRNLRMKRREDRVIRKLKSRAPESS